VTAEGQVLTASEEENGDLFWALRGGGGNFGVVTRFTFRAAAIGKEVTAGLIVKRFCDAASYMAFHRDYVRTLPDEMTVWRAKASRSSEGARA
jgi:FAD/FMN-containing dehydrogenase